MSELEKAWDELFSSGFYLDGWDFKLGQTQTQQEVKGVLELLGIKKDDHILDWCGGYGRHAIELARLGYTVTLLDKAPNHIELAEKTAQAVGITPIRY